MGQSNKLIFPGAHQSVVQSNVNLDSLDPSSFSEVFLLLHGYSEKGEKMMKRIGRRIMDWSAEEDKKVLILAPNGLYPMPKSFPLGSRPTSEDLLQGFAWYFYDQTKDEFLIDYAIPAQSLIGLLKSLNPLNAPTSIIGYSQGGYLAPFVGLAYEFTKHVIGLNCSYRTELFAKKPHFKLDQVQGDQDSIIDTKLCSERFRTLKENGLNGDFHWLEGLDHRLAPQMSELTIELLKNHS